MYVSSADRLSAELAALPLDAFLARTAQVFASCFTVDRAQFRRANTGAPLAVVVWQGAAIPMTEARAA